MSDRLCYIRRTDRGIVLRGLRLVGGHTDDSWVVDPGADTELILETINEAAEWVKQRLDMGTNKALNAIVLDTDGAACTWVKPADADADFLDSAVSDGPVEHDPDDLEPIEHNGLGDRLPRLPREMDFQALSENQTSTGARRGVLAIPDVPGRLLKDTLDSMGIRPEKFTSIWHALCAAWDPGLDSSTSAMRIVSSDAPICAIVAIDPIDARLIWSWSREGKLICAGSARLRRVHGEHEPRAMIWNADVARLASDWLGWSSQLGVSPSRVVVLGEPICPPVAPDDETPDQELPYDAAQLGAALTQRWPDATLDLLGEPDPIGATLQRIAQREMSASLSSIEGLVARPTRAHRSMFRWAGLALTAAACVVFILAWQLMSRANEIKSDTRLINNDKRTLLNDYDPNLILSRAPVFELETRLGDIRKANAPVDLPLPKPMLEAIETISFVLGTPNIDVTKVTVNTRTVTLAINVTDIAQAEQILRNLQAIEDDKLNWRSTLSPSTRGNTIQVTILADWKDGEASE